MESARSANFPLFFGTLIPLLIRIKRNVEMLWEEFKLPIWVTEFDWNANNDVGEQLSIWAETLEKLRSLVLQTWVSILSTQNRSTTSTHWCSVLRYRLNLKDAYKRSGFPRTSNFFCSFRLGSARYTYVEHEHCGRVDNRAKQGWPRIPATYQVIHARLTHVPQIWNQGRVEFQSIDVT